MDCKALYFPYSLETLGPNPSFIQSELRIIWRRSQNTSGLHLPDTWPPPPSIFGSLSESIFGYNLQYANIKYANINGAGMMLEEDMGVGECWRISGGSGHVAINLSEAVFISHITMDHASPSLLSQEETTSAPKSMALWALLPPADDTEYEPNTIRLLKDLDIKNYSKNNLPVSSRLLQLIDFQYDISKQPTRQTFQVPFHVHFSTQTVFLEIKSNEGSRTTCIYWLGIYGVDTI